MKNPQSHNYVYEQQSTDPFKYAFEQKSALIFAPQCLDRKQPVGMQSQSGQRWSQVLELAFQQPAQSFSPVLHQYPPCLKSVAFQENGRRHALFLRGLSPQLNMEEQNSTSCARAVTAILQTAKSWVKIKNWQADEKIII